ncbi:hypothetical protein Syun_023516 [Stephania yunnanensis]|uniref:Uncharacterized protein n=1 Tax=Stephania yunnanensis TaxID=152371 RepID=A0AAP0I3H9_9MAGN
MELHLSDRRPIIRLKALAVKFSDEFLVRLVLLGIGILVLDGFLMLIERFEGFVSGGGCDGFGENYEWKFLRYVGPGFHVSLAYLDLENLETNLQAGANNGYEGSRDSNLVTHGAEQRRVYKEGTGKSSVERDHGGRKKQWSWVKDVAVECTDAVEKEKGGGSSGGGRSGGGGGNGSPGGEGRRRASVAAEEKEEVSVV